jgi:hypothetical protein
MPLEQKKPCKIIFKKIKKKRETQQFCFLKTTPKGVFFPMD